ncbi:MAG TPA: hypothetical protein VJM31_19545, partial [Vicinamibacterales bacterium]|nr:hypothetical protein [Vicinamibacterales bacterium]
MDGSRQHFQLPRQLQLLFEQLRVHREFSAIQQEIARLQESGATPDTRLLEKKLVLARELEVLSR